MTNVVTSAVLPAVPPGVLAPILAGLRVTSARPNRIAARSVRRAAASCVAARPEGDVSPCMKAGSSPLAPGAAKLPKPAPTK